MESTRQAKIRRLQDTLIVAGNGVIAFGAWSLAKTALFFAFIDLEQLIQLFGVPNATPVVIYIATAFVLAVELIVRTFVGLSARSEGRGKKKSPFYLIVAVFIALLNVWSASTYLFGTPIAVTLLDQAVSCAVELTSLVAVVTVAYCSIRLRLLNKAEG